MVCGDCISIINIKLTMLWRKRKTTQIEPTRRFAMLSAWVTSTRSSRCAGSGRTWLARSKPLRGPPAGRRRGDQRRGDREQYFGRRVHGLPNQTALRGGQPGPRAERRSASWSLPQAVRQGSGVAGGDGLLKPAHRPQTLDTRTSGRCDGRADGARRAVARDGTPPSGRGRPEAVALQENLVVLTGAGTSVSSGGKTMDKLERAVLDKRRPGSWRPSYRSELRCRANP
jgi:hypothetical protein